MASGKGFRAVFLDRDGVINEVVFREGRPASPRTIEEFRLCEGIAGPLHRLSQAGFRLFVISNQPDVARGFLDPSLLELINGRILASLPIKRILVCTHDDAAGCQCRKPQPGMLYRVAANDGVDLTRSFLIGDSWKDMEAGQRAGCTTIMLRRAYNQGAKAHFVLDSVGEAVDLIVGEIGT